MDGAGAEQFFRTFVDQWKYGGNVELKFLCERGYLKVSMCAEIGPWKAPAGEMCPNVWVRGLHKASPSRLRRRERRAAEREQVAAAEKVAKKADAKADAEIAEAGRAIAETIASEVLVEVTAAEKAAVERATAENAAVIAPAKTKSDTANAAAGKTPAGNDAVNCDAEVATTSCKENRLQCLNCDGDMTAEHQCRVPNQVSPELASVSGEHPPPLPLCHYCCHRGSGNNSVHYYLHAQVLPFGGYQKWYFRYPKRKSETTFRDQIPP